MNENASHRVKPTNYLSTNPWEFYGTESECREYISHLGIRKDFMVIEENPHYKESDTKREKLLADWSALSVLDKFSKMGYEFMHKQPQYLIKDEIVYIMEKNISKDFAAAITSSDRTELERVVDLVNDPWYDKKYVITVLKDYCNQLRKTERNERK